MQIIYKNKDAQNKKDLIKTINCLMGISSDRLCIFFATEDNNNKPDWKIDGYDKLYSLQGFYINLEIDDGIIPRFWPDEVNNCILGKFYKHFIWISKRICEDEDVHFAWVYSHELQHLKQSLNNPYLLILAKLLDEVTELDDPTEFDCERKAKEIIISIFGEDKCNSYLRKMKAVSAANDKRYSKLLELNITADFDVEQEIQQDICTKKKLLKGIQKKLQNNGLTNWNISIDKLCSCKNPHKAIISAVTKNDEGIKS